MKKLVRLLFIFLGILLAFQTTTSVQASRGFNIAKYNVDANVQKNGDVDLTQKVTYSFNDEFHGVYYKQDLKKTDGASDPKVYMDNAGKITQLKQATTGKNNTFKLTKTKNAMNIKVYHYVIDERVSYIYKYKIFGLVTNYSDTSALNWKVIGNGWENDLNNVKLTINLPQNNISQLQAWTHGPLTGYTKVDKKRGRVVMTMANDAAGQYVESHMMFPTAITPLNTKVVNKNAKARILNQEKQLANQANAKRRHHKEFFYGFMLLGILIVLVTYIYRFDQLRKHPANKHKIPTPLHHLFDEPPFLPSMTQVILEHREKASSLSLTADMLNEVGHHRMDIKKEGSSFSVTALVPPTNTFYKYLFEDIGDGKTIKLSDLRRYAQGNDDEVTDKFETWSKQAAASRGKYLDQHNVDINSNFRTAATATSIIAFIMFLIATLFKMHILIAAISWLAIAVVSWVIYFLINKRTTSYTDLGEEEVNKIRAFKRMLEDINDIKLAEVGDLILWESFLPYAVVFGISDKVIRALKVNFGAKEIDASPIAFYYLSSNSFAHSTGGFQTSFINSLGAGGSSSIIGGSGGFSGGSSGGAGGGSGGGAF